MLAAGDYSQRINHRFMQLGSGTNSSVWREEVLTGSGRAHLADVRGALGRLLDVVAARGGDVRSALESFTSDWLKSTDAANGLDWRWYFVRYPEMRSGTRRRLLPHLRGPRRLARCRLKVPQVAIGGRQLDTKDRVELGAALLRDLVSAGL